MTYAARSPDHINRSPRADRRALPHPHLQETAGSLKESQTAPLECNTPLIQEKYLACGLSQHALGSSLIQTRRGGSVAIWGLVIETTVGVGERKHAEAYVLAHV